MKDLPAPDAVKCMAWVGDSLCLGIRREYVILNISTGASFDVFPCGRHANPLAVSLPNGELLLGKVMLVDRELFLVFFLIFLIFYEYHVGR